MAAIRHLPGPYRDLLQTCVRCGVPLADHRNAAWPEDEPAPRGWNEGIELVVEQVGACTAFWPAVDYLGASVACSAASLH